MPLFQLRARLTLLGVAGALALGLTAPAFAATAAWPVTWPDGLSKPQSPPGQQSLKQRPGIQSRGRHSKFSPNQQYTITDVGSPNGLTTNGPTAFNNAGQIAGFAYPPSGNGYQTCVVWNGKRFTPVATNGKIYYCYPLAINEAQGPQKGYEIGGYAGFIFDQNSLAFVAKGSRLGAPLVKSLSRNAPSLINGVNKNGVAIGEGFYFPPTGTWNGFPPFELQGKTNLDDFKLLQPGCTVFAPLCMQYISQEFLPAQQSCAFGGCSINDNNEVLGIDAVSNYMVFTVGNQGSAQDLPMTAATASNVVGINNAHQIAFAQYNPSTLTYQVYQYTVGAAQPVAMGQLGDVTCNSYLPLSQNNLGQVLGIANNCTAPNNPSQTFSQYWTWDAGNGMNNLSAMVPGDSNYQTITPIGINDKGQILVSLLTANNVQDWGMLNPPTAQLKKHQNQVQRVIHQINTKTTH